ncbi:MAG: helix-turn-helix domain-containing protein [Clostridia bacterium]|nr:helix-turn-helix domain-containing protein [Clostridia bacterium]
MKANGKIFSYDTSFARGQMAIPAGEILQIAELSLIRGGEIREHIQRCDEITYAVSGKATVYSGSGKTELTQGQIHFIRRGEYHRIVASSEENFHYYCIGFLPNEEEKSIRPFLDAIRSKRDFAVEDQGDIKALFSQLLGEVTIRDEESPDMIHFYFCQMLIWLYRIVSGKAKEKLGRIGTSSSNQAVYRALKLIDREYMNLTQVKEIAAALSYSEYHLCHVFKEKMNLTLKEYLMQKKLMMAVELLETSSMTVTEIAGQLCFATPHAFSLAFKRYFDTSPSAYRKNFLKEE